MLPRALAFAAALTACALAFAPPAEAKSKIDIVALTVKDDSAPTDLDRRIRRAIHNAADRADFGKRRGVELDVRVVRYDVEVEDDFVRVTCTIVAKLKSGKVAKSHLSFGGKAAKRKKLERQVISAVADGLVIRLAHLVKEASADDPKK